MTLKTLKCNSEPLMKKFMKADTTLSKKSENLKRVSEVLSGDCRFAFSKNEKLESEFCRKQTIVTQRVYSI